MQDDYASDSGSHKSIPTGLLEKRGQGERLEVFNSDDHEDFRALVSYFSNEVSLGKA